MTAPIDIMRRRVGDLMGAPPASLSQDSVLAVAVKALAGSDLPVAVTDQEKRPVGLLSHADVVRKVTWRLEPETPVAAVMTAPAATVSAEDTIFVALVAMRRRGVEHSLVVDGAGRLKGWLHRADAMAGLGGPVPRLVDLCSGVEDSADLVRLKAAQVDLAAEMLADGVPAPQVQALVTELNAELHRRTLDDAIAHMIEHGWGPPPIAFALIVMGSAGRGENSLAPDQDNGLILADHAPELAPRVDAYFAALTERFTHGLDALGFPLCKGGVMASNPEWRRTQSAWKHQIAGWLDRRAPQQLLASDILFDFAHVWGEQALSDGLRGFVTAALQGNTRYVRALYAIESDHTVALGWFGRLRQESDEAAARGAMNLKLSGTLPLVEGARLLALRTGIAETATSARLDALAAAGLLGEVEHADLVAAYGVVTRVMLSRQIADARAGREVGDFVAEEDLAPRDRNELVAALRAIGAFRSRLKSELGTGPFG